jgi:class 3 adenylate cyclase
VSAKLAEATSERAFRYRNEHRLIGAFNSHLAPEVTARLLGSGEEYGRPRLIQGVVLFADVRGFTTTSLTVPPDELAIQLGEYLEEAVLFVPHLVLMFAHAVHRSSDPHGVFEELSL